MLAAWLVSLGNSSLDSVVFQHQAEPVAELVVVLLAVESVAGDIQHGDWRMETYVAV